MALKSNFLDSQSPVEFLSRLKKINAQQKQGKLTGIYTPFSSPIQSPELQQKAGGIEMAGVNPVGTGSPYGQNQYGNVGQGTNGITVIGQGGKGDWLNNPRSQGRSSFGQTKKIMSRIPSRTSVDMEKRNTLPITNHGALTNTLTGKQGTMAGIINIANQNPNAEANQVMKEIASGKIKKGDREAAIKRYDELRNGQVRNINVS